MLSRLTTKGLGMDHLLGVLEWCQATHSLFHTACCVGDACSVYVFLNLTMSMRFVSLFQKELISMLFSFAEQLKQWVEKAADWQAMKLIPHILGWLNNKIQPAVEGIIFRTKEEFLPGMLEDYDCGLHAILTCLDSRPWLKNVSSKTLPHHYLSHKVDF